MSYPYNVGRFCRRFVSVFILVVFLVQNICSPHLLAQILPGLTNHLSINTNHLLPVGISLNPAHPLEFELLVDQGAVAETGLKPVSTDVEGMTLIKYFLASLTMSEKDMWVNLSPTEPDRVVPPVFAQTAMGRDMLAQDAVLKQLTSSLMNPEGESGKKFWEKVYDHLYNVGAIHELPLQNNSDGLQSAIESFNKVWIVPAKAVVYQKGYQAYVVESRLKVMLEGDYEESRRDAKSLSEASGISSQDNVKQIIRTTILPLIEDEVNNGEAFANLRQMYHAMILAYWFKQSLKKSLLGQVYVNQNKVSGISDQESEKTDNTRRDANYAPTIEEIYQQYLVKFKQGAFDVIKEDYNPETQATVARKYFSGGVNNAELSKAFLMESDIAGKIPNSRAQLAIKFRIENPVSVNAAMLDVMDKDLAKAVRARKIKRALAENQPALDGMASILGSGVGLAAILGHGTVYTDNKKLLELGHNLVKGVDGQWSFYDEQGGKHQLEAGEASMELLYGGPFMAERFALNPVNQNFIQQYVTLPEGVKNVDEFLEIMKDRTNEKRPEVIQSVLVAISQKAYQENPIAENFVKSSGEDIGRAFATLIRGYLDQKWVENIVLVSGVGEKFANPQVLKVDQEDMFLKAIRQGLYDQLMVWKNQGLADGEVIVSQEKIENIIFGFQRSKISYDRELVAARLTAKELERFQSSQQDDQKIYSLGFSIGGTKVGIALIDADGNTVQTKEIFWQAEGYIQGEHPEDLFIKKLSGDIKKFLEENQIDLNNVKKFGFSLGMPVDPDKGIAGLGFKDYFLPFLDYPFVDSLRRELGLSQDQAIIRIYNDAWAAAMGEQQSPQGLLNPSADDAMLAEDYEGSSSQQQLQLLARQEKGVAATTIVALFHKKLLNLIINYGMSLKEIKTFLRNNEQSFNEQYLLGALRAMSSAGWLVRSWNDWESFDEMRFGSTSKGYDVLKHIQAFERVSEFTSEAVQWMDNIFEKEDLENKFIPNLKKFAEMSRQGWNIGGMKDVPADIQDQINGYLVGPILLAYTEWGFFGDPKNPNRNINLDDLNLKEKDTNQIRAGFEIMEQAGYLTMNGGEITLTEIGVYAVKRYLAFGVPVSYYPSYALADRLMFGEPLTDAERYESNGDERLVLRKLNVKGSGYAHEGYFMKAKEIMIRLVNKQVEEKKIPFLEEVQASGKPYVFRVTDIGAGDGKWLELTYEHIRDNTLYGDLMREHPEWYQLEMIGVDYNQKARDAIDARLIKAGYQHRVFHGDIGKVSDLKKTFESEGIKNGKVNVVICSMLPHNRPWYGVDDEDSAKARKAKSTGVFGWKGKLIPNNDIEQNLYEFFKAWRTLADETLIIELHTINDQVARDNSLKTLNFAYELSHLFSDQFIVEFEVYKAIAEEAGWKFSESDQTLYPQQGQPEMATVSISYMEVNNAPEVNADPAMFSTSQDTKGGIDFDSKSMQFETSGDAAMMNVTSQQIQQFMDVPGFRPLIIQISPVASPRVWLGLNASEDQNKPQKTADRLGKNSLSCAVRQEELVSL